MSDWDPQVVICRLLSSPDSHNPCEIIKVIRDIDVRPPLSIDDPSRLMTVQRDAVNCCCTWTRDSDTGRPLFCVAGEDAKIKVYDVNRGELVTVSLSHGRV
jgi:polycomb protein EED